MEHAQLQIMAKQFANVFNVVKAKTPSPQELRKFVADYAIAHHPDMSIRDLEQFTRCVECEVTVWVSLESVA